MKERAEAIGNFIDNLGMAFDAHGRYAVGVVLCGSRGSKSALKIMNGVSGWYLNRLYVQKLVKPPVMREFGEEEEDKDM